MLSGQSMLFELFSNVTDQGWRVDAACRGLDPEIFFPERGDDLRPARDVCRGCTVQVQCLEYSVKWHEKHGVWGGTSERERRRIWRRRAADARRERNRLEADMFEG
jgi:WhiB family transcriptional regulator, redox-sensing transcriptional regulator